MLIGFFFLITFTRYSRRAVVCTRRKKARKERRRMRNIGKEKNKETRKDTLIEIFFLFAKKEKRCIGSSSFPPSCCDRVKCKFWPLTFSALDEKTWIMAVSCCLFFFFLSLWEFPSSFSMYSNYSNSESLLDLAHRCFICRCRFCNCMALCAHMPPSTWPGPLPGTRAGGGPSALEASCTPTPPSSASPITFQRFCESAAIAQPAEHLLLFHPSKITKGDVGAGELDKC